MNEAARECAIELYTSRPTDYDNPTERARQEAIIEKHMARREARLVEAVEKAVIDMTSLVHFNDYYLRPLAKRKVNQIIKSLTAHKGQGDKKS